MPAHPSSIRGERIKRFFDKLRMSGVKIKG
jgi:hypothetical protein